MCGHATENNQILGQRLNTSQGTNPKAISGISVTIVKCNNCRLIYSNPQPIPVDIQDHYGVPPESYWTDAYFLEDKHYFHDSLVVLNKLMTIESGMKALDIGAGIGKCIIALDKVGFDTYGLEPSVTFRDKAISRMNIDGSKLKLGMVEDITYDPESFDFITFGAVLEHLYDPAANIEKALNWLKPNGLIHIEVPSSSWLMQKLFNYYYRMRGTTYVTNLSPMHEPYHMFEFEINSFLELSKRLNFSVAHFEYPVCNIFHVPKILHKPLKWYMKKSNTGMQLSVWLRK
ncbi:MAG: class I SAM-dependent methyltransferase [Bacteroidia bacterium]|nr:class I SAM-dependent methyltransferase [Bacteroidia bacterium]